MPDFPSPLDPAPSAPAATSLSSRLVNVFVSPTEVFDEVKVQPHNAANWLVPVILSIIVAIIYSLVVFSNEAILQRMRDTQEKAMQDQVDKGKMTRQQADQALAMAERFTGPTFLKVIGILFSFIMQAVMLFFPALIIWLVGRFALKADFDYLKAVEVVGLSAMVSVPGGIVAMLLAIIYGNVSMTASPVLLLSHFDPNNKLHVALSMVNIFLFWQLALMSIGLARVAGRSFLAALLWLALCFGVIIGCFGGVMFFLQRLAANLGGK